MATAYNDHVKFLGVQHGSAPGPVLRPDIENTRGVDRPSPSLAGAGRTRHLRVTPDFPILWRLCLCPALSHGLPGVEPTP
jgi:hypothetical protein